MTKLRTVWAGFYRVQVCFKVFLVLSSLVYKPAVRVDREKYQADINPIEKYLELAGQLFAVVSRTKNGSDDFIKFLT